jgi:chromosome segregation ATPase
VDDAGFRGGVGQAHAPGDVDRLEALEQQVRQLTSRLAGWVEAQLVQAVEDRRNDIKALRAELQIILNEQLAGMRAEAGSVLSVATRRLEVGQEQLTERLDAVAERAADAAATATALSGAPSVGSERLDALEQRVRSAMSRLSDSVETRLTEVDKARQSELDALRSQLQAIDERVGEPASAAGLSALSTRLDQQLEEVAGQAAAAATTRSWDLEGLRSELTTRIEELQRTGGAVSGRVDAVAQQTSAVADEIGALRLEVKAGTARNDELEKRVKAAVGRLAESVENRLAEFAAQSTKETTTKLAEMANERRTELEAFKAELEDTLTAQISAAADKVQEQLDLAASAAQLESLQVAFEEQADRTEARLDAFDASVPATLREAEARLRQTMQAKQGDLEAVATRVAKARTEMNATLASVHRKLARTEDLVERRLATVGDQVDALTRTAATEVGSLAPLRSDLRRLEGQVAELAEVVAELRPKRKAPTKKVASPAKKVAAKKAVRRKAQ